MSEPKKILRPGSRGLYLERNEVWAPEQRIATPKFNKSEKEAFNVEKFREEYNLMPTSVAQEKYRTDPAFAAKCDALWNKDDKTAEGAQQ